MSRILRRPMFRGGRVDSRGTGITSGLMDGGRVGYNRGMLVQPPGASRLFSIQDVLKPFLQHTQNCYIRKSTDRDITYTFCWRGRR